MARHGEQAFDLSSLLSTPIQSRISSTIVTAMLSQHPFLPIPGALNIRDISVPPYIRKGLIYRSGALEHITPAGKSSLIEQYGIRTIYDLRTRAERNNGPSPDFEGAKTLWIPSTADSGTGVRVMNNIEPKNFIEEDGKMGFLKMYTSILESHKDAFRAVLLHLRDREEGGVLFHCKAGKDRTGVLTALILGVAGAPPRAIANDYALTRIGIEPAYEQLLAIFQAQTGFSIDQPGFAEMCGIQAKTISNFLEMLDEKWGGVEGYVKEELGLVDRDIDLIRENLRGN